MGFQTLKQCNKMPGVNYGDQNIEDDGHKSHKVIQKFKMAAVSDSKTMLDGNIRY